MRRVEGLVSFVAIWDATLASNNRFETKQQTARHMVALRLPLLWNYSQVKAGNSAR